MAIPYWRLSAFYWFYFASLGALMPFWSVYLQFIGCSVVEIGQLMALFMATKIIAPNIWGWIADAKGRRMLIVQVASLLSIVCFVGVFISDRYGWMACVMTAFSFFWNASLPQFEVTTFNHLGQYRFRYSRIRVWGSVGFIATVSMVGPLLDYYGVRLLPWVVLILFVGIALSSLFVPEKASRHLALDHQPLRKILQRPMVLSLLIVCFLMQAGHGAYYTFYSIHMGNYGYSSTTIGLLWALGVFAEVILFLFVDRWMSVYGVRIVLLLSFVLATVRWLMIGLLADSMFWLIIAQILHAASFGMYHASAIQIIHHLFKGPHQGRGQALYSSISFGAGGAVGSLYSGYFWESMGASTVYLLAALLCLIGFWLAWRGIKLDAMDT